LDKNEWLKKERGICFEDIAYYIEKGNLLDIIGNPNQNKYKGQKIYLVKINKYVYIVPYFEDKDVIYLITIIPSRKMTKKYLEDKND
jgi:c-di-AMP phosphodiesterase-like protein